MMGRGRSGGVTQSVAKRTKSLDKKLNNQVVDSVK